MVARASRRLMHPMVPVMTSTTVLVRGGPSRRYNGPTPGAPASRSPRSTTSSPQAAFSASRRIFDSSGSGCSSR